MSSLLSVFCKSSDPSPLPVMYTAPGFCSFIFQSLSGNRLLRLFQHLPQSQTHHLFNQNHHLSAPLTRKRKYTSSRLRPRVLTPRAVVLYPTSSIAAYQVSAIATTLLLHGAILRFLSRRAHLNTLSFYLIYIESLITLL